MKPCNYKISLTALMFFLTVTGLQAQLPEDYQGKPYKPYSCYEGVQCIPGRIELAWYDLGGEGVAYHDVDSANNSVQLSHTRGVPPGIPKSIAYFREDEGVDIGYVKYWVDYQQTNLVPPKINQQYIGWQEDGEWTNYTIDVKVAGRYRIIAVYGNKDNGSSLWLNNEFAAKIILPEGTGYWHIWNKAAAGEISFPLAGLNLLTLKYNAGANLACLDFVLIESY
jgi:hypothetical protein